ncbi:hypothetical protein QR680_003680 [Steinernema hermaphroditum]|uniref:7TM GPCR serpentine receptor class x (Srx) domain-containing protein n=1 Tax=Steinernema hermaphroditum TaxID=289476 RepID=A0AA39HL67_9BILA|nr:hypothetical protein QR680_003680 [Steinernema hermaphroditum]
MANMSQKEEFVFGSEMEGRGVMSTFDTVVGVSIWVVSPFGQPKDIPPTFGITIFMIGYFFAAESCSMHQFVSANRMLAVCAPLKYDNIFTRKVTRNCILFIWTSVTILMSLYIRGNQCSYDPGHGSFQLALIVFNPEVRRLFRGKPEAVDSTTVDLFTVDTATVVAPPKDGQ